MRSKNVGPSMRSVSALVMLNLVLLLSLVVLNFSADSASGQLGLRNEYVLIAGDITGKPDQAAVYILELKSQRMVAIAYDSRSRKIIPLGSRVISEDVRAGGGR